MLSYTSDNFFFFVKLKKIKLLEEKKKPKWCDETQKLIVSSLALLEAKMYTFPIVGNRQQ